MSQHRFIKNNKSCARRKIIIMKLQRKSLKCPAKYLLHSFHPPDSTAEDNSSMLHQARWVSPSLDPWTALREPKWKTTETFCLIQQLMKLKTKAEKTRVTASVHLFLFRQTFLSFTFTSGIWTAADWMLVVSHPSRSMQREASLSRRAQSAR